MYLSHQSNDCTASRRKSKSQLTLQKRLNLKVHHGEIPSYKKSSPVLKTPYLHICLTKAAKIQIRVCASYLSSAWFHFRYRKIKTCQKHVYITSYGAFPRRSLNIPYPFSIIDPIQLQNACPHVFTFTQPAWIIKQNMINIRSRLIRYVVSLSSHLPPLKAHCKAKFSLTYCNHITRHCNQASPFETAELVLHSTYISENPVKTGEKITQYKTYVKTAFMCFSTSLIYTAKRDGPYLQQCFQNITTYHAVFRPFPTWVQWLSMTSLNQSRTYECKTMDHIRDPHEISYCLLKCTKSNFVIVV